MSQNDYKTIFGYSSPNLPWERIEMISPQYELVECQTNSNSCGFNFQDGLPTFPIGSNEGLLQVLSGNTTVDFLELELDQEQNPLDHYPTNVFSASSFGQNCEEDDSTLIQRPGDASDPEFYQEINSDDEIECDTDKQDINQALDVIFEKITPQRTYKKVAQAKRQKQHLSLRPKEGKKVKKDAVWKQFLRGFRHYFQEIFIANFGRGIDHWDHARLLLELKRFVQLIRLQLDTSDSQEVRDREMMALIMILRTTAYKKPPKQMQKYVSGLLPLYWKIFVNNNNSQLELFFQEDLVRKLWVLFPLEQQAEFLRKLHKSELKLIKKDFKKFLLAWPEL